MNTGCRSETGDVMLCADAACGWLGRCVVAEPMSPGEAAPDAEELTNEDEGVMLYTHAEVTAFRELAASEGTRAVKYLRRARKAEAALREIAAWAAATPGLTVVELGKVLSLIGRRAEQHLNEGKTQ